MRTLIALLFFATTLGAYELEDLKNYEISNPSIGQIVEVWDTLTEYSMDTGASIFQVTDIEEDATWEEIIEESLDGEYVDEIMLQEVEVTLDSARGMVWDLFYSSAYLEVPEHMKEVYISGLGAVINSAIESNPNIKVYDAGVWGAFDASYYHIILVDTENNQMVSIYGGYSE